MELTEVRFAGGPLDNTTLRTTSAQVDTIEKRGERYARVYYLPDGTRDAAGLPIYRFMGEVEYPQSGNREGVA